MPDFVKELISVCRISGTYKPDDAVTMNDDPDDGSWDVLED